MTGEDVMTLQPGEKVVLTAPYPAAPFQPPYPVGTVATVVRPDMLGGFRSNRRRVDGYHPCVRVTLADGRGEVLMPEYIERSA